MAWSSAGRGQADDHMGPRGHVAPEAQRRRRDDLAVANEAERHGLQWVRGTRVEPGPSRQEDGPEP